MHSAMLREGRSARGCCRAPGSREYCCDPECLSYGVKKTALRPRTRRREVLPVRLRRQTGDADSGVAFVANVESDEQRGNLFDDAGVFEFAAVDGADAGDFRGEFAGELRCVGIVAADDDVAVERIVSIQ